MKTKLFLTILILIMGFGVALTFLPPTLKKPSSLFTSHNNAVYLAIEDDLPVSMQQFMDHGVQVIEDLDQAPASTQIVYIHPDMINTMSSELVRTLFYQNDAMIITINTSISTLSILLETNFEIEDIPQDFLDENPSFGTIAFVRSFNGKDGGSKLWTYYDFFQSENMSDMFGIVENHFDIEKNIQGG